MFGPLELGSAGSASIHTTLLYTFCDTAILQVYTLRVRVRGHALRSGPPLLHICRLEPVAVDNLNPNPKPNPNPNPNPEPDPNPNHIRCCTSAASSRLQKKCWIARRICSTSEAQC